MAETQDQSKLPSQQGAHEMGYKSAEEAEQVEGNAQRTQRFLEQAEEAHGGGEVGVAGNLNLDDVREAADEAGPSTTYNK